MTNKTAILLLNMGGPDSLAHVKPFLYNLFSDPDIIRLPFSSLFQKPLAYRIASTREHEAQKNYAAMGGASPIVGYTQAQADAIQALLVYHGYNALPIYIGMRYWHPFTEAAVTSMKADGVERVIVLPLYPHFSYTTSGSSLNELLRMLAKHLYSPVLSVIQCFYQHPLYQQAIAENIQTSMNNDCWDCSAEEIRLLFTAHSLPLKHIKRTKDPYPEQIYETAESIAKRYFPHNAWDVSYQSQVGKMPWKGPSTDGLLHYYSGKRIDNILMVAISFVSDHVETLVEIDQLYIPLATELEIRHCHRAPALNTNPVFIQALTDLVIQKLPSVRPLVRTGISPPP